MNIFFHFFGICFLKDREMENNRKSGAQHGLSVNETNKLRRTLGLTPLKTPGSEKAEERQDSHETESIKNDGMTAMDQQVDVKDLQFQTNSNGEVSLSVNDTNKLRMKLGLKPLNLNDQHAMEQEGAPQSTGMKLQAAAKVAEAEARIREARDRRLLKRKIGSKTLGDGDGMSASSWIKRSKRRQKEVLRAQQRAAEMEELEQLEIEARNYDSTQLSGVQLSHDLSSFEPGQETILTLKDTSVLNETADDAAGDHDVLENPYLAESDQIKKKSLLKTLIQRDKMVHAGLDDGEFDEFGRPKEKSVLSKYDKEEEIKNYRSGHVFDSTGQVRATEADLKAEMWRDGKRRTINLEEKTQNDGQMIEAELDTEQSDGIVPGSSRPAMPKLKKLKKKRRTKKRKELRPVLGSLSSLINEEEEDETEQILKSRLGLRTSATHDSLETSTNDMDDFGLEAALTRARQQTSKAFQSQPMEEEKGFISKRTDAADHALIQVRESEGQVLTTASEFSTTIQSRMTTFQSGTPNPKSQAVETEGESEESVVAGGNAVEDKVGATSSGVNGEEPSARAIFAPLGSDLRTGGMAAALAAFRNKGATVNITADQTLKEKTLTTQERAEKLSKRQFKLDLTYRDDEGNVLTAKEAYKLQSHRFHGNKPGKIKLDKLRKRKEQQQQIEEMKTSDTPLNSAAAMRSTQQKSGQAFVEFKRKV